MNNRNTPHRESRARRRPSVNGNPVGHNNIRVPDNGRGNKDNRKPTYSTGPKRPVQNNQHQISLASYDSGEEKKLIRARDRYIKKQKTEAEWQKGIVRVRGSVDGLMLGLIILLVALGSLTVFSASYPIAILKTDGDSMFFIRKQIAFAAMGLLAMGVMCVVPVKWYRSWAPLLAYVIASLLLIIVLFKGKSEGEAIRWLYIGPVSIQPSEIMKLAIILTLAWYYEKFDSKMKEPHITVGRLYKYNTLIPVMLLGFACVLVLIGKHLSGTIIVGMIGFLLLIVAGCNIKWLMFTALPAGAVAVTLFLVKNPYALKRITTFTDENADKLDEMYQTTQSLYAIGSGGLLGVGPGNSRLKYSYLTQSHTDFIFSVWCEETGFVGAVALILLFLAFVWRGYVIALRAPDKFTMLTAFGITTHVGIQSLFNMCVAADIFPNTGITLPFFSYGGSSLMVLLFEMGILLAISRQYYKHKDDKEPM